ncbi:probable G-protein coupled receptor 33 [Latimeria chalumnae]|uniref:probable G-protein coupled receptor 33 n=1 Tax=Latimeria chalumnae TaxID=7897 RepID=UPI0003C1151E|nr:PREDICTED: probable G-protein coupled receptor 33 [Latimeria chalumnae]|eukprot:XP_005995731.1 PREDICTED: probable G-protein coupled receptor 33 [Latimeria chalumnae]
MDRHNGTLPSGNANSERSQIDGSTAFKSIHILMAIFFISTFLVGLFRNGTFFWILGFKMKWSVNTKWFTHLILHNLIFTSTLPFYAGFVIMDYQWYFGRVMCKLLNTALSFNMFFCIFLLTIISVDRLLLTTHPVWCKLHRTNRKASLVIAAVWIVAGLFSSPYLALRDTRINEKNKTVCSVNYALSSNWSSADVTETHKKVQVAMFVCRLLFGFVIPFLIITTCYVTMAVNIKTRRLSPSSKPFKVIAMAVVSFFVCWLPYHVHSYLVIKREILPPVVTEISLLLAVCFICFYSTFTPVLYILRSEGFKGLFRKSVLSIFEAAFSDQTSLPATAVKSMNACLV